MTPVIVDRQPLGSSGRALVLVVGSGQWAVGQVERECGGAR